MPFRVSNVRLPFDAPAEALGRRLADLLGLSSDKELNWRILRKSLDARDKSRLEFVYSLEFQAVDPDQALSRALRPPAGRSVKIEHYVESEFQLPQHGVRALSSPPVVVGSGPAGLVAAYLLAEQGYCPVILERGRPVRDRIHDVGRFDAGGSFEPESNYLFGEGGAGTFSDGKLTCRGSGPDVRRVLELIAECKGKPSILYEHRPHLGSNRLPAVVKALRQRIEGLGGKFRFSCRVEDLDWRDGQLRGLNTSSGYIAAEAALLAIGHSARDTYEMLLRRGVPMVQKAFQMGVRIEQPQETVNRVQYGRHRLEDVLGSADYSLVAHGRDNLFTFCMCAGGHVIPSVSQAGYFCTNGMSLSLRGSPFANSGLVSTIPITAFGAADVMAGVRLQEQYERRAFEIGRGEYRCPIQRADDFLAGRATKTPPASSYRRGVVLARIEELVPPLLVGALREGLPQLDRRWHGKFLAEATLVGPESRGSSPIRIVRDDGNRESPGISGLYPVGEGAGYAGGIVSAAVDGLRSAKALIAKYAPLRAAGVEIKR